MHMNYLWMEKVMVAMDTEIVKYKLEIWILE